MQYFAFLFAQVYGSGSYDSITYGGSSSASSSTASSGSILTNTGFDIALVATLACIIIFVALLIRFWKRPAQQAKDSAQ